MAKHLKAWIIPAMAICGILFIPQVASTASDPVYGGSVVVAISSDPAGLNPAITTQGGVQAICGSIFSGLVAHDFDLNPVPDLAERWDVSPDGRTYTFHLAPEAVFHDGVPVTSEDVMFTFEQLLLKYHSRTRTSIGDNLRQILTPDAHTVAFEFNKSYAAFLKLVDVTNAPVMPKQIYQGTEPLTNPHNTNRQRAIRVSGVVERRSSNAGEERALLQDRKALSRSDCLQSHAERIDGDDSVRARRSGLSNQRSTYRSDAFEKHARHRSHR